MALNVFNIVVIRMQNVSYINNRSLFGAMKDLIMIDKHRMFYKGLLPQAIASSYLIKSE